MEEAQEFRKKYEYEEENGVTGFLLLFFLMLISVDIIVSISLITQGNDLFKVTPVFTSIFLSLGLTFLAFLIFTGVALFKLPKYAAQITKVFLLVRLFFLAPTNLIIFNIRLHDLHSIGRGYTQYATVHELFVSGLILPLFYIIVFSLAWYIYFVKSKKVKSIYGKLK